VLCVCGYHRKHALRRLKGYKRFAKPKPKKRDKPAVDNKEIIIRLPKQKWLTSQ
jgi:hypothetical protein